MSPVTVMDASEFISREVRDWLSRVSRGDVRTTDLRVSSSETQDVIDPGTGKILATVPRSQELDVRRAITIARERYESGGWRRADPEYRERVLLRLADLVDRDYDTLVTLEALDTGKPRVEAEYDITEVASVVRYYAGWCTKIAGRSIASPSSYFASTIREAVGVCAAITPWNYPLPILMYKLAPALAFGNSFIAKPSEMAPLSSIYFFELCAEAGIPEGVLSLILGGRAVGSALVAEPGVDKIAFTGSTETGRSIMRAASAHPTRVSLELGGKSPQLVFASADLDAAVEGVAGGIWTNAGQICIAGSRLLIDASVKETFLEKLMAYTSAYRIGHALDPTSRMGPMISQSQLDHANGVIRRAEADGARIEVAGTITGSDGYFLRPTLIDGLSWDHSVHQEEIFGPALAVETFHSEDEAIFKANSTQYGLAAGIWTGAAGQGQRVARAIQSGTVWINMYGVFHPTLPFGGTKASGFGRELGESAIEAYTEVKTVIENLH